MANSQLPSLVIPKPGIPKTIGLLNVLFGTLLLLTGIAYLAFFILTPTLINMSRSSVAQTSANVPQIPRPAAEKKDSSPPAQVQKSTAPPVDNQSATTGGLKVKISPGARTITVGASSGMNFEADPLTSAYGLAELVSGVLLNVAMIVAGAGLMGLRGWSRRLAIWVAALKIVRLVAMTVFTFIVLVPQATDSIARSVEMNNSGSSPTQTVQEQKMIAAVLAMTISANAVAFLVFAAIYPVVVIVLLTRRSSVAACFMADRMNQVDLNRPAQALTQKT